MRANTVMPLALTSASSRFIVCSGSKSLGTTINPSAGIFGLDGWVGLLSIGSERPPRTIPSSPLEGGACPRLDPRFRGDVSRAQARVLRDAQPPHPEEAPPRVRASRGPRINSA